MKKFLKINSYDSSNFTEENVLNKTHWMVKILDRALELLDIGSYSLTYVSNSEIQLSTVNYGTFIIEKVYNAEEFPYLVYIDSENKELWGGSYTSRNSSKINASGSNCDAGLVIGTVEGGGTTAGTPTVTGGLLFLKFDNLSIKGTSAGYSPISIAPSGHWTIMPNSWSCPLPERYESRVNPLSGVVSMTYCRKPILNRLKRDITPTEIDAVFEGEYFQSIYITDKYYQGALRSADGKKFCFAGCLFDVDDATDIEDVI